MKLIFRFCGRCPTIFMFLRGPCFCDLISSCRWLSIRLLVPMLIYWKKRKHWHEKKVQFLEKYFGPLTWPPVSRLLLAVEMIGEFRLVSDKCYKRKIRVRSGKVGVRVRGKFLIIKARVSGFGDLIRGGQSHKS